MGMTPFMEAASEGHEIILQLFLQHVCSHNITLIVIRSMGRIGQSLMCLTADTSSASSILASLHNFTEIDHEVISTAIFLPSVD